MYFVFASFQEPSNKSKTWLPSSMPLHIGTAVQIKQLRNGSIRRQKYDIFPYLFPRNGRIEQGRLYISILEIGRFESELATYNWSKTWFLQMQVADLGSYVTILLGISCLDLVRRIFSFFGQRHLWTRHFSFQKKSPQGDEFRFSVSSYLMMSSIPRSSSSDFVLEQVFFETNNKIIISQRRRRNYSMPKVDDSSIASNNFSKRISGEG